MSWSLPRLYLRPQRTSRSSELSVSRPDFCKATLRRVDLSIMGLALRRSLLFEARGGEGVAAVAVGQVAGDPADSRDADAGLLVDLAVGHALLEQGDDGPAVREGLQLRRRAQVAKERPAFLDAAQGQDGAEQRTLREDFLAGCDGAMLFHWGKSHDVLM